MPTPQMGGTFDPAKDVSLSGELNVANKILCTSVSGGVGYGSGAGGVVTQASSKATGVTLNALCGTITMNGAQLNATTSVQFVLSNSYIAVTDVLVVNFKSANTAGSYFVSVDAVAAGSATISLRNYSAGNLSEAVVLSFVVIKGVAA